MKRAVFPITVLLALCAIPYGCMSPLPNDAYLPPDELEEFRPLEDTILKAPLDSDTVVALALKHDPTNAILREEVRVARAQRQAAKLIPDPELRFSYGDENSDSERTETVPMYLAPWYANVVDPEDPLFNPSFYPGSATGVTPSTAQGESFQIALRLRPPNPWAMKHRVSAAEAGIYMMESQLQAAQWRLAAEVQRTYENVQYLQEDLAAIDRLVGIQQEMEKIMEERAKAGGATIVDMMTIARRYLMAVSDRDRVSRDYAIAVRTLAGFIGTAASSITVSTNRISLPAVDPGTLDAGTLETIALKNRADLTALEWQSRMAYSTLQEAHAMNNMPWFSFLQASYGRIERDTLTGQNVHWTGTDGTDATIVSPEDVTDDLTRDEWRVDAGVTLPLFSVLTDSCAVPRAEYWRSKTELSAVWRTVLSEVRACLADLRAAGENLAKYERDSGPHLDRMRTVLQDMENQGDLLPDDAARIRDVVIMTERTKSQLQFEYRTALISLTEAVGTDLNTKPEPAGK